MANELIERRQSQGLGRLGVGTDLARQQLQDHCDRLNAMVWVRASGKPYFVGRVDHERLGIMREGERTEAARS